MSPLEVQGKHLLDAAQRDFTTMRVLMRDAESPVESILFHAQQALEKSLKAALVARGVVFRRTHDLVELHDISMKSGIAVPVDRGLLMRLGPYAVEFRYLGVAVPEVGRDEARAAVETSLLWSAGAVLASATDGKA